jgi:hypothetical protein
MLPKVFYDLKAKRFQVAESRRGRKGENFKKNDSINHM